MDKTEQRPGILFVDDEPILCELVDNMLANQPYRLLTATSPEEGLSVLEKTPVDLVFSDYMMRNMDGLEFLHKVRERQPFATRIIVTGYAPMDVFINAIKNGEISRIMHKPWDREEFLKVISDSISASQGKLIKNTREDRYKQYAHEMEQRVEERTRELGLLIDTLQSRNEKLEEMHNQLMQSDKVASLGLLVGTIAHDISNPLTVIKGSVDLVCMRHTIKEDDQKLLQRISKQADRIENFVASIRNFSKQAATVTEPVDLESALREALLLTRHFLTKNDVLVENNSQPETSFILGDPARITQLFMNLIQNAAQAMPDGGTVSCEIRRNRITRADTTVNVWVVTIADTGIGIAKEEIGKIFETFYTAKKAGTGLGLNICKRVVEDHDGTIEVESRLGHGTTFTITFPAYVPEAGEEQHN